MSPRRLFTLALLAISGLAVDAAASASDGLQIGQAAPMREVHLRNIDGRYITMAEVAGKKGTLVIFMCNHCPWVKLWQTRIASIGHMAIGRGVGVIAINANDPAAYPEDGFDRMKAQAKQLKLRFPYAM